MIANNNLKWSFSVWASGHFILNDVWAS